ncbi:MAG: peptidase M20 [Rhodobacterales bacterium]|nr:MAG: peptidase M20 [Rhodobacterales bacterium]
MRDDIEALTAWRRALHRAPEISGEEIATAAAVADRLTRLSPDDLATGVGGHGVLARFAGSAPHRRVLLRCELDGLPIAEQNPDLAHVSMVPGKGHMCGHDGHMAILMGVAERLADQRIDGLDVVLLFQPAEETGAGARAVINDPAFAAFRPDFAVSLHNMPGLPLGHVQVRPGPFACASRGLRIVLAGRTAHASQPETGLSPARAMCDITALVPDLTDTASVDGLPRRTATLTHARLGAPTFGVAPGEAEIRVTLRTVLDDDMAALTAHMREASTAIAQRDGLEISFEEQDVFSASTNHPAVVDAIHRAAQTSGTPLAVQPQPMRFSEDFGEMGALCPSAMFLLGAGETCPALHNPDYDFPDALIAPGIAMFMGCLHELRGQNG